MQDRYAGDIGDYGKIGLLKALQAQGLSIGVNWYLVEPMDTERKVDGTYKQEDGKYLIPEKLQVCDTLLAEKLTKIAKSDHRSIRSLEQGNFILNARYYSEPVSVAGREEWHKKALDLLNGLDISELCIKVTLNPRKRSNYAGLGQMHSVTQVTLTQCINCRISKHFYV